MIIPFSIPAWFQIQEKALEFGMDIKVNVNPLSGMQSGHVFFQEKTVPFRMHIYSNNLVLSFKDYDKDIFDTWDKIFDAPHRVVYRVSTEENFSVHGEWYFDCPELAIIEEIMRIVKSPQIEVIELPQTELY